MPKSYHGKPRTLKQRWSFERRFWSAGTLARTIGSLLQLSEGYSVLPDERRIILEAVIKLREASMYWRRPAREGESWKNFERKHLGLEKSS